MPYGPVIPTLRVADLPASLEFYTGVLGFTLKWSWRSDTQFDPTDEPDFACVECGQAVLFLSHQGGGVECSLFVELPFIEHVDELAEQFAARTDLAEEPQNKPWGSREFLVQDPDSHAIRFSCPLNRSKLG